MKFRAFALIRQSLNQEFTGGRFADNHLTFLVELFSP